MDIPLAVLAGALGLVGPSLIGLAALACIEFRRDVTRECFEEEDGWNGN